MKFVAILLVASAALMKCSHEDGGDLGCKSNECTLTAQVKDLTGLDGCGIVLETADGAKLIPERRVYIKAPTPAEDPLYYFPLHAGDIVRISYQETQTMNTCMAGKTVFLTCIKSCNTNGE